MELPKMIAEIRQYPHAMRKVIAVFIERKSVIISQPLEFLTDNEVEKLFDKVMEMADVGEPAYGEIDLEQRIMN